MTKQEVLNALRASKEIQTMGDTHLWRLAFDMFNRDNGTKIHPRDMCMKCYHQVLEYLQS